MIFNLFLFAHKVTKQIHILTIKSFGKAKNILYQIKKWQPSEDSDMLRKNELQY